MTAPEQADTDQALLLMSFAHVCELAEALGDAERYRPGSVERGRLLDDIGRALDLLDRARDACTATAAA
jgi:hypothetical protein